MAKRTEGFDEAILKCARQEFLDKGYEEASLRTIAKCADVSTSTIYTRFNDKEGLFKAITEPAAKELLSYMQKYMGEFQNLDASSQEEKRDDYSNRGFKGFIDLIYKYFDEFKLITTCSTNDLYRYYFEKIVETDVDTTIRYLTVTENEAYSKGRLTDEFIYVVSSAFYSGIFEIARKDMKRAEAQKYAEELSRFYSTGWQIYI